MEEKAFLVDADEVAEEIKKVASESITEEDLRQGVEYILKSKVLEKLQIPWGSWRPPRARYEVTLVSGARVDALYGHVIIEYEKPGTFASRSGFEKSVEQVKRYIRDHAQIEARFPRYFGVILDGYKIGFIRYRSTVNDFESKGPFDVNRATVARFIEAIVGLRRKALSAEDLLKDFGPTSQITREVIKTFYNKLLGTSPRTEMLFEDWRRVFSQVCAYSPEKLKGLEAAYGFRKGEVDVERLLFALHTYYALIMKLLAAEVASLYVAPRLWSYLKALEDAYYKGHEKLRDELKELEEGGIFARLGITNFLEADYFAWYLDEWDAILAQKITNIVRKLSDYDPSAAELEPERVKDLFKRLYQNLVPRRVRHDLGEYYTPDWLADLVLDEVGWTVKNFERKAEEDGNPLAPLELRFLDPACGSGTFLVLAIGRLRRYIEEHWIDKGAALKRITKNIVGFDLNPLAVIASRANYLIALGDLLRERGTEPLELPIYLADSILVERRSSPLGPVTYVLRTAAGQFTLPTSVIDGGFLPEVLPILEECLRGKYTSNEFKEKLLHKIKLNDVEVSILKDLFNTLSRLEKEGKNRIWLRVLRNSFAPLFTGKFHFVVGNPPWINWESLPRDYRESTRNLWLNYGLIRKFKSFGLGKVKKDIAMLFVALSLDRYLQNEGKLALLVPFTLFKTQAGAGFRAFLAYKSNVIKIHDLVELAPFEGAINRTSLLIVSKGKTSFPVPCLVWRKMSNLRFELSLENVIKITKRNSMVLEPLKKNYPETPWIIVTPGASQAIYKAIGASQYRAYEGVNTALNGVYWIEILEKAPGGLLISNLPDVGKKKLRKISTIVETDMIYPLIRGRDVKKWFGKPSGYIIVPHDQTTGKPLREGKMKIDYSKTFRYLLEFKKELENRSLHKLWGKSMPFYSLYDIGSYTFAPYKVVWKYVAGRIAGKGMLEVAVISPHRDDKIGEKTVIPNEKLMLIPFDDKEEAYYVAAVLNSSIARLIVAGYTIETAISTHVVKNVKIPKFDSKNSIHKKLASLSKKAHKLASEDAEDELIKTEEEIDRLVAKLYGITNEELREIKKSLAVLEGKEFEEAEEVEEMPLLEPDITILNPVITEGKPTNLEIIVKNPFDEAIANVKIKAKLPTKNIEKFVETLEKEEKVTVELEGLKKGKYEAILTLDYTIKGLNKKIEKKIMLYVKGEKERNIIKRGDINELFGVSE